MHLATTHFKDALNSIAVSQGKYDSLLPVDSFFGGTPCLVEIPKFSTSGLIEFTSLEKECSLITGSTLGAQSNQHVQVFWSKPEVEVYK